MQPRLAQSSLTATQLQAATNLQKSRVFADGEFTVGPGSYNVEDLDLKQGVSIQQRRKQRVQHMPSPGRYDSKMQRRATSATFSKFVDKVPVLLRNKDLSVPGVGEYEPKPLNAPHRSGLSLDLQVNARPVTPGAADYQHLSIA